MTGNISYLSDFEEINGGYVAFGRNPKGGKITGKFDGKVDEGFLVGYSNTDVNAAFEVKEPKFEVHVSPSSSAKTKKHDDKTTREAKGKSLVSAASTPVPTVEPNSTNNTNTFSVVGPSNTVVSLNFDLGEKSSYVDPSQYPDDPDIVENSEIRIF
nr:hypothetical protein [Tanacetum cinerariifolium]